MAVRSQLLGTKSNHQNHNYLGSAAGHENRQKFKKEKCRFWANGRGRGGNRFLKPFTLAKSTEFSSKAYESLYAEWSHPAKSLSFASFSDAALFVERTIPFSLRFRLYFPSVFSIRSRAPCNSDPQTPPGSEEVTVVDTDAAENPGPGQSSQVLFCTRSFIEKLLHVSPFDESI